MADRNLDAEARAAREKLELAVVEPLPDGADLERFEAKVFIDQNSGCWLWMAGTFGDRYGAFKFKRKTHKASRVALALKLGRWPSGMALHSCDNPCCVNPDHLREGTALENARDRNGRGRHSHGESHYAAKLTTSQVREIRILASNKTQSIRQIAEAFSISRIVVWKIAHGVIWKDVS